MTTPSIKPSRVIRPPRRITLPSGQKTYELACDDGKSYTSGDLAVLIGLANGASLVQRMARMGWDSPTLLAPPAKRGFSITGESAKNAGSAEWAALSGKDRSANLWKIPAAGTFELTLSCSGER